MVDDSSLMGSQMDLRLSTDGRVTVESGEPAGVRTGPPAKDRRAMASDSGDAAECGADLTRVRAFCSTWWHDKRACIHRGQASDNSLRCASCRPQPPGLL